MNTIQKLILLLIFCTSQSISKAQNCPLTCPSNIMVKADPGQEGASVTYPPFPRTAECGPVTYSRPGGSFFRLGSHSVIITDATGQKCSFTITVTDNEAPKLSEIIVSPDRLWPASSRMKKVGLQYTVSDNSVDVKTTVVVTSNSPVQNSDDWEIINNHLLRLRANRLPDGSPKIYTITVNVTDEAGNKTNRTTTIAVSKTMVAIPTGR